MSTRYEVVGAVRPVTVLSAAQFFAESKDGDEMPPDGVFALVADSGADGIAITGTPGQLYAWLNQARAALAAVADPRFDHLSDPAERAWLSGVSPSDVRDNAHRIYDYMEENGIPADSYTRELAFEKAAAGLGIDYDVLYYAWMDNQPVTYND